MVFRHPNHRDQQDSVKRVISASIKVVLPLPVEGPGGAQCWNSRPA